MGSSGEASEKSIDPTVGGLVWVRRRNGSWWPGRILGLDEVSESCVVSPRSGTPVKLLGREDASVDWYNLEKSKRVKAFRCGEYDDCIAKAKASAANSGKKAVKYARREDAIIHALEIESSRLGNADIIISAAATSAGESPSSVSQSNPHKTYDNDEDDEDDDVNASGLVKNPDSLKESPIEDPNLMSPSKVQSSEGGRRRRVRRRSPNDSEDEGVKRMRGLEDLGLGVKVQTGGGLLELVKLDNASSLSDSRNSLPNGNGGASNGGGRGGAASVKRKRSQVAASNGNEFSKRKNRRRPLTKVLESSTAVVVVAVPVVCNDGKVGPRLESVESKRSGSDCNGVLELNRDTSSHVNNGVTKENGTFDERGSVDQNGSYDKLCDLPFVGEQKLSAGPSILVHSPSDKPKVRGLKRQSNQAEGPITKNEPVKETSSTSPESGHTTIGQRLDKSPSKWQSKGKRNSRKTSRNRKQDSRKYSDMDNETSNGINGMKPEPEDGPVIEPGQRLLLPHRQSRFTVHSRYRTSDSLLYEVKVEVKRNERPPHVPLVSLMSKLTGKAVVGHPVAVEVLEDGFCDRLLSLMEKVVDGDEKEEEVEEIGGDDLEESHTDPVKRVPVVRGKGPKAKKPGLLPKKIRKLSSLTGGKKSEERKVTVKIEKPKVPVIACIPLKLVFSRINEAVNGSARQMNRV